MKKLIDSSPVTLVILYSFIPLLYLIGYCAGYTLVLRFGPELIGVLGIYSLIILFNLSDHKLEMDRTNIILSTLTFPLAFLTGLCVISNTQNFGSIILCLVCLACGFVFLKKTARSRGAELLYKLTAVILTVLLCVYALTSYFLNAYDASASDPIISPAGTYTAQVSSSGQSASVEVYETDKTIELYVFYYKDIPQRIFIDNTGRDDISISFADEHTLVINGTAYMID